MRSIPNPALALVLLCLAALLPGCGMSITPPAGVEDPVSVFVVDHGIHTSLLLPRENGEIAQYAFSQWHWAALDQDQWYRSPFALLIPNRGTLGRRDFRGPCDYECCYDRMEKLGRDPPMQALFEITVSREAARALLAKLDERWHSQSDGKVYNERRGMTFVRDARWYSLAHTCNREMAGWLRELGCRVDGPAISGDVTVRGPKPGREPAVAAQNGDGKLGG